MIGQLLDGKYETVRLIGEGGMGAVYEARNTETGQRCAVKVINDEAVARDEVLIQRFEREAYAAKKVHSPYIVEILDAGHDAKTGHPYMVMEMLDGENALQLLKRLGPLPPQLALRIAVHVCEGLAKAHAAGVVHRDIKPANLFLTDVSDDERVVKLLDFGVAKFKMEQASESDNESLTRTGSMLGSPMYMSPEQARGLKTIDHRADVWSLGIVMHQLLTGRVPHQDIDGLGELIITICSEPPPLVNEDAPWVSQQLANVIAHALKLSTDERFQSASDLGKALRGSLVGDDRITTSMLVRMTDEDRAARPDAAPRTPSPSPAAAKPPAFSHDATVALEDVEEEIAKAAAAKAPPVSKAPTTQPLPATAPTTGGGDLAATVALPQDTAGLGLPPEEKKPAVKPVSRRPARAKSDPAPASAKRRERDAASLAKHRDAQRAAIDAARLDTVDEKPGGGRIILAILIGVAIGGGGLGLYYLKTRQPQPQPQPQPQSQQTGASSTAPAKTSAPQPSPAPSVTTPPTESASAPSSSAATGGTKVSISPPYANVTVDGTPAKIEGGEVTIEGEPGSVHVVKVSVGQESKNYSVTLTDQGPKPNSIVFQPSPRPVPSSSPASSK